MKKLTTEQHAEMVELSKAAIKAARDGDINKAKELLELQRRINEAAEDVSVTPAMSMSEVKDAIAEQFNELKKQLIPPQGRKAEYSSSDAMIGKDNAIDRGFAHTMLITGKSTEAKVKELQILNDELYICSQLLGGKSGYKDVDEFVNPTLRYKLMQFRSLSDELTRAMTTAAGSGNEWIPTAFSAEMIELMELQLRVAGLHDSFDMPTSPYTWPIQAGHARAYYSQASGSDDPTKLKASTPTTGNVTFTAKKLHSRVVVDTEVTEDSIVPILPFIRTEFAYAMALAVEDAIINGDTAALGATLDVTDMYSATIDSQSPSKAWAGYRRIAAGIGGMSIDNAAAGGATLQGNLRDIRATLGKYGSDMSQLAYVTSVRGHSAMLKIAAYQGLDKVGPRAVLLNGQVGFLDNIPLVISPRIREDLNGSGVSGGASGATMTMAAIVYRPAFKIGRKRALTVKSAENINTDQIDVVVTQRLDFQSVYGTGETTVGVVVDI